MELHRTRTFPKCDLNGNAPAVSQAIGFGQGRWTLVGRRVNTISTDDALAFDIIDADNDTDLAAVARRYQKQPYKKGQ